MSFQRPRISTPDVEGLFQAAKWLKIQALINSEELAILCNALGEFAMYPLSGAYPLEFFPMSIATYLQTYSSWIQTLQEGHLPDLLSDAARPLFASMWTTSSDALWLQQLPNMRYVARPCLPFLQVQMHYMSYSDVDQVFRSMSLGPDRIFWGLQFSFPQVFQHPTKGFLEPDEYMNRELFQIVRTWSREHTVATPMLRNGARQNLSMRLGKQCFSWIHRHPQLQAKNFTVLELKNLHAS